MHRATIARIARLARSAFEAMPSSHRSLAMGKFPAGACGDASLILGAVLSDMNINGFEYVCGERGSKADNSWTSHAWLRRGELVVDITADQFPDAPSGVIVEDKSPWHQTFEVDEVHPSDFRLWSGTEHLFSAFEYVSQSVGSSGVNSAA